jgi:hypothetical protein
MLRPRPATGITHGDDLHLRMHLLPGLRAGDGRCLPKLRWRTGQAAHQAGAKADREPALSPAYFAHKAMRSIKNCGCRHPSHLTDLNASATGVMFFSKLFFAVIGQKPQSGLAFSMLCL